MIKQNKNIFSNISLNIVHTALVTHCTPNGQRSMWNLLFHYNSLVTHNLFLPKSIAQLLEWIDQSFQWNSLLWFDGCRKGHMQMHEIQSFWASSNGEDSQLRCMHKWFRIFDTVLLRFRCRLVHSNFDFESVFDD